VGKTHIVALWSFLHVPDACEQQFHRRNEAQDEPASVCNTRSAGAAGDLAECEIRLEIGRNHPTEIENAKAILLEIRR
jgi:hypothetical protein